MGSLSFGEIITIILVILIIFGPNRLPEFSRKIGEFVAKARNATSEFTSTIQNEMGDDGGTMRGISEDIAGIKKDVSSAASAFTGSGNGPDANPVELPDDATGEFDNDPDESAEASETSEDAD